MDKEKLYNYFLDQLENGECYLSIGKGKQNIRCLEDLLKQKTILSIEEN